MTVFDMFKLVVVMALSARAGRLGPLMPWLRLTAYIDENVAANHGMGHPRPIR